MIDSYGGHLVSCEFHNQNPRDASTGRGYSYFNLWYIMSVGCPGPPDQTKNDTDLKLGRHTPVDHI